MAKTDWQKITDFQQENKHLFFIVASLNDEISLSFNGKSGFVRFPMESQEKGVVFNALRKSKFNEAIDPFMAGVIEGSGIDIKQPEGNELLKTIGGAVKSLGVGEVKLEEPKKTKNGKKN